MGAPFIRDLNASGTAVRAGRLDPLARLKYKGVLGVGTAVVIKPRFANINHFRGVLIEPTVD